MKEKTGSFRELFQRHRFGIRLGLERMEKVREALGAPDRQWSSIHIAGTNGKGSTAAILERIMREAGCRTGLYTSPHLVDLTERFRIDGIPVLEAELRSAVDRILDIERSLDLEVPLTFFEVTTAAAFCLFADHGVRWGIVETGLGGRLDATNVIRPKVSVITSIGLDHCEYLGKTLPEIAREKGGIIKQGVPVVCGAGEDSACEVIHRLAEENGCHRVCRLEPILFPLRLRGAFQRRNAALAVAAIDFLKESGEVRIPDEVVRAGLAQADWPGRLQVVNEQPFIIVDGAHNPSAAREVAESLREEGGNRSWTMIVGILADKDISGILSELGPVADRLILTPVDDERSWDPSLHEAEARRVCRNVTVVPGSGQGLRTAGEGLPPHGGILITGSLYLVGEVLQPEADPPLAEARARYPGK